MMPDKRTNAAREANPSRGCKPTGLPQGVAGQPNKILSISRSPQLPTTPPHNLPAARSSLGWPFVVSTLVIAALFNPLRRSIQSFMDRLFYRRNYDARKTLEAFSARLRYETNLDALGDNLVVVVMETMQPIQVPLWLRSSDGIGVGGKMKWPSRRSLDEGLS
jgi:hypothetical protein